jgi:feruloyl-CoA synthase
VRAIFLDAPPSIDAGEITDKGSLNNGNVRKRRAHLIDHLYADGHPLVIAI